MAKKFNYLPWLIGGAAAWLVFNKSKSINGINGINDPKLWNKDRLKKNLGKVLIDYRNINDSAIKQVSKSDISYSNGMSYVINQIFTDKEQFEALYTQLKI